MDALEVMEQLARALRVEAAAANEDCDVATGRVLQGLSRAVEKTRGVFIGYRRAEQQALAELQYKY